MAAWKHLRAILLLPGTVTIVIPAAILCLAGIPVRLLTLWGPDVHWAFVQQVWFWAVAILKMCPWLLALVVLWLTLWAWQLRKRAGSP